MEKQQKALQRRGLFGIRSEDAQRLLSDRDSRAQAAADELRSAEERASASEARVAALEVRLAELAGTHDAPSRVTASTTDPARLLLALREEMTRVMHATEEAGSRIIDHARTDADHLQEESERRRSEIEAEREQLAGWIAQLQQSSPALRQGIVETAGALNRTIGAMNEAGQSVARMFGRMADAEAMIQRNQSLLSEAAVPEIGKAEVVVEHATQPTPHASTANWNGLLAPEPPVDVSGRVPWALRDGDRSNGSREDAGGASVRPAVIDIGGTGENDGHVSDGSFATSRAAGPVADPRIDR